MFRACKAQPSPQGTNQTNQYTPSSTQVMNAPSRIISVRKLAESVLAAERKGNRN